MRETLSHDYSSPNPSQPLLERLKHYGKENAFVLWDELSHEERLLLIQDIEVAKSLDGNGGVYLALKSSMQLEDMATRGIKYLDYYGVDNALAYPQEKVGVFVRRGKGGHVSMVEYSEMDSSLANAINQKTGRLRFR